MTNTNSTAAQPLDVEHAELLTKQVASWRKEITRLQDLIEHATGSTGAAQPLDLDKQRTMYDHWWHEGPHPFRDISKRKNCQLNEETAWMVWQAASAAIAQARAAQPESATPGDDMEAFKAWKGYELPALNADGHFDKDWLHREWVAFRAGRKAVQSATGTTGAIQSIDTPEFQRILGSYIDGVAGQWELIAHIDAIIGDLRAQLASKNAVLDFLSKMENPRELTDAAPASAQPDRGAAQGADVCAEMRALCSNCGGTGEVHRADGEYVGTCDCMFQTIASPASQSVAPAGIMTRDEAQKIIDSYSGAGWIDIQDDGRATLYGRFDLELVEAVATLMRPEGVAVAPSDAKGKADAANAGDFSIRGPLTDAQRDECRTLYNNLKHLQAGGYYVADDVIRAAAVYGYTNGYKDFHDPATSTSDAKGKADDEILALHRQLAAERLRADEGWQRADAKSKECIELRERMCATSAADAKDAARLAYCVANGFPQCLSSGWWAPLPNGHLIGVRGSGPIEAIDAAMAAAPSSEKGGEDIPDECVATGQTCSYGPHGRRGEMQCIYCGAASSSAAGKEGGDRG